MLYHAFCSVSGQVWVTKINTPLQLAFVTCDHIRFRLLISFLVYPSALLSPVLVPYLIWLPLKNLEIFPKLIGMCISSSTHTSIINQKQGNDRVSWVRLSWYLVFQYCRVPPMEQDAHLFPEVGNCSGLLLPSVPPKG